MADFHEDRGTHSLNRVVIAAGAVLGLVVLALSSIWLFRTVQSLASTWQVTSPEFSLNSEGGGGEQSGSQMGSSQSPIVIEQGSEHTDIDQGLLEPWSGTEPVNILLLGIDQRCDEEGPTHTDTMMVVSLDPVEMSAVALSVPRDLWTVIPNFGVNRVNQAHFLGQVSDYPGGGPALAAETVEAFLGIPIQYYGAVNFDAFTEFVDLIGGIDVEVPEDIDDPKYPDRCYGYDPFRIEAGQHHLEGAEALKYARTRATFGGDVDRAGRQQQVLMAVRDKILDVNMVPRLITQAPQLWQSFQANVRTNLTVDEAIQLALLAQDIPQDNIRLEVIDYSYLLPGTTPDGQQVLMPQRERIRDLRDALFAPAPVPRPTLENPSTRIAQENARVSILNGTPTFGLAAATQEYLQEYGIQVTEIGNAETATNPTTRIFDYTESHVTASYLAQLMDVPPLNVIRDADAAGDHDVLIILGSDWQLLSPAATPTP